MTITAFQGGQDGFAIFLHDVTLQRENEERRERLLGQERETVVKLQALDQLKDNVISHVSHELRSPLTSILGYTQLLTDEDLDEEQQRFVKTIARNANRLQRVIDDLLFLSRADVQKVELPHEPVDLGRPPPGRRSRRSCRSPTARSSRRDGDPGRRVVVEGDAGRLGQVVDNLLSNAVKYTPAGGTVRVRLAGHGTAPCSRSRTPASACRRPSAGVSSSASSGPRRPPTGPSPAPASASPSRRPSSRRTAARSASTRAATAAARASR